MILFQKNDSKFRAIKSNLLKLGVQSKGISGSPLKAPLVLWKLIFSGEKPVVYVFRYLNDYPSLLRTLLRLFSEILVIMTCKLFNIKIWWLCHNVDKETLQFHLKLSALRRHIIKTYSMTIFTTHRLLKEIAKSNLNHKNIKSVSLGYIEEDIYDDMSNELELDNKLLEWLRIRKNKSSKIVFVVGTPVNKALHFERINGFIREMNILDADKQWYGVVVGGPVEDDPNVFNIPYSYSIKKEYVKEYVDYYYRVMDDYSVSYTLFEAATLRKPIITEDVGFLPLLIREYKIGYIFNRNSTPFFVNGDISIDCSYFESFLNDNNWSLAAKEFFEEYKLIG